MDVNKNVYSWINLIFVGAFLATKLDFLTKARNFRINMLGHTVFGKRL